MYAYIILIASASGTLQGIFIELLVFGRSA
jgi:hypothetical protein